MFRISKIRQKTSKFLTSRMSSLNLILEFKTLTAQRSSSKYHRAIRCQARPSPVKWEASKSKALSTGVYKLNSGSNLHHTKLTCIRTSNINLRILRKASKINLVFKVSFPQPLSIQALVPQSYDIHIMPIFTLICREYCPKVLTILV